MGIAPRRPTGLLVVLFAIVAIAWSSNRLAVWTRGYVATPPAAATAGTWVNIGPAPMSVLARRDDPEFFNSGLTSAIAVDPSNANHWVIGAGSGGVWESVDGGSSWLPIADSSPTLATGSIAFAPSDPRIIYVGTGHSAGTGNGKVGVGVLKSTDGGRTWVVLGASSFARTSVRRIRVDPADANLVLAATTRGGYGRDSRIGAPGAPAFGVQKSIDGGVSWVRTLTGQATALEIDATNFNTGSCRRRRLSLGGRRRFVVPGCGAVEFGVVPRYWSPRAGDVAVVAISGVRQY
jgi:hypothetical protein